MTAPRKRFGQHFLSDQSVIQHIIAVLAPRAEDRLVEIGPGQGALTYPVLKQTRQLEVVELDRDLIPILEQRGKALGELVVHAADVLDFDFATVKTDDRLLRVFGNLPYNISTPLIFHLLKYQSIISDMVFMVQKEVAERLAAAPDTDHYGRLSVMVQYHCQVDLLFDVAPDAFYPPPKVISSIIRMLPHKHYPCVANDEAFFGAVVKQAFSQRRKTLRNSLRTMVTAEQWEKLPIASSARPEQLSVKEFVELANVLGTLQ